jgi:hypothetical protein
MAQGQITKGMLPRVAATSSGSSDRYLAAALQVLEPTLVTADTGLLG